MTGEVKWLYPGADKDTLVETSKLTINLNDIALYGGHQNLF